MKQTWDTKPWYFLLYSPVTCIGFDGVTKPTAASESISYDIATEQAEIILNDCEAVSINCVRQGIR